MSKPLEPTPEQVLAIGRSFVRLARELFPGVPVEKGGDA